MSKTETNKIWRAIIYLRLSREDGDKLVSNSIQNQSDLIRDYLKNCPDIVIADEISDDGWSGVDFSRPGFQRAMDLIRAGKADCICVKDLTRFSRNFTEAGKYLEHVLPFLGCRFIAVNDGIDSSKPKNAGDNIVIPFKNLVADAYLRDISVKIRSQFEIKRKKGDFIGSFVSFGYIKDERDHNKILIDEYAAEIVRMIFKWRIDGLSQLKISDKLNELGILSPMEYKRSVGLNYKTTFKSGVTAKWSATAVKRVITNEIYIGNLVQGKSATPNHKIKKNFRKPENDWVRVIGNHDAIISEQEFALANELAVRDTRVAPSQKEVYLFSGMLRCGQCGENMTRKSVPRGGRTYRYYVCCNRCKGKRVSETLLTDSVTEELQKQISNVIDIEQLLNYIDTLPLKQDEVQKTDKLLNAKKVEIERLSNLKLSLYETMVDGLIDEGEYTNLKNRYTSQIDEAEKSVVKLQTEIADMLNNGSQNVWIEQFKKYHNFDVLNRRLIVSLIDIIKVHDSASIEIIYKFSSNYSSTINFVQNVEQSQNIDFREVRYGA